MKPVHYQIKIKGEVQGVGFRYFTRFKAQELGLFGFVTNESNGGVCIEVEGPQSAIDQFIEWCHEGPPSAEVQSVKISTGKLSQYDQFWIKV